MPLFFLHLLLRYLALCDLPKWCPRCCRQFHALCSYTVYDRVKELGLRFERDNLCPTCARKRMASPSAKKRKTKRAGSPEKKKVGSLVPNSAKAANRELRKKAAAPKAKPTAAAKGKEASTEVKGKEAATAEKLPSRNSKLLVVVVVDVSCCCYYYFYYSCCCCSDVAS